MDLTVVVVVAVVVVIVVVLLVVTVVVVAVVFFVVVIVAVVIVADVVVLVVVVVASPSIMVYQVMARLGDMQDPYCVLQWGGKWSATTHVKDGGGGDVVWEDVGMSCEVRGSMLQNSVPLEITVRHTKTPSQIFSDTP